MKHIKRWNSEKYKGKTGVYRFSPIKTWGLIIMITFFVGLNIVHSQYKVIAELYYYSMQSPEETDRFIEDNQVLFDNQFFSHLAEVR